VVKGGKGMTVIRYCTPEWLEESASAYRSNPKFQKELEKLSTKVCFRIKAEPDWGIDKSIFFCAFIKKGELERLAFLSEEDAKKEADYILAATTQEWKILIRKDSKFLTDFMLGKIKLEHGSVAGVLGIAPYSNTLVEVLTQFDLQFPDEMSPEELEEYRDYLEKFRVDLGV